MRFHPAATRAACAVLLALTAAGCGVARDDAKTARPARTASTAPPAPTATPDRPAARSAPTTSYPVKVLTLRLNRGGDRPLRVPVWYPDAPRGRFPLVLFSHGLGGEPEDYQELLRRWARAGFVVAAPAYPRTSGQASRTDVLDVLNQPSDASYVITAVLALDGERGPLRGRIDTARVGAAGHSAGGVTTIGLFTAGRDERLDAGVVLAGNALGVGTAFAGAAAPMLFVHGGRDPVVPYSSGRTAYDAVPWPKAFLTLPDGDHGRGLLDSGGTAFWAVVGTTLDFLRWSLYGDDAARLRLARPPENGVATLDNKL